MKKIIIAGGTSFIGMHLIQRLAEEDCDITVVVRPESEGIEKIRIIKKDIKILELELKDYPLMYQYIDKDIDCFIPLTWAGTRKEERDDWQIQEMCMENMSRCVENIMDNCSCKCIITPGSVAEYGSRNKTHKEDSVCYPDSMYGRGKLKFYQRVKELCQNNGVDHYHIRIFSIYGPDDYDRKVINTVVKKLLLNEDFHMSSCRQQWNLLYIDDLVKLFLVMINKSIRPGCYNIGANENVSLRTYIETIENKINSKGRIFFEENNSESINNAELACDNEKLLSTGKWQPEVSFDMGIERVIAYMAKSI